MRRATASRSCSTSTPRHMSAPPGDSSLDDAVRAAGGLVRAYAARSRRAVLVIGTPSPGSPSRAEPRSGLGDGARCARGRPGDARRAARVARRATRAGGCDPRARRRHAATRGGRHRARRARDARPIERARRHRHADVRGAAAVGVVADAHAPRRRRRGAIAVVRRGEPLVEALGALRVRAVG